MGTRLRTDGTEGEKEGQQICFYDQEPQFQNYVIDVELNTQKKKRANKRHNNVVTEIAKDTENKVNFFLARLPRRSTNEKNHPVNEL